MKSQVASAELPISKLLSSAKQIIFVSPHLDDAIFSAGGLILSLVDKVEIKVVTVFTKGTSPLTLSGKQFLKQSGFDDLDSFYAARCFEDLQVGKVLGADFLHAPFEDALFRKKIQPNLVQKMIGKLIPEFIHEYPTYRFHIASGKLTNDSLHTIAEIEKFLQSVISSKEEVLVFCPVGTGRHVDHLVVRQACQCLRLPLVFWDDFPYSVYCDQESEFIEQNQLTPWMYQFDVNQKVDLMKQYHSQYDAVFARFGGKVPNHQERFFTRFS